MSALPPTGPELFRMNRRVLAERTGWPALAVEICEDIEDESPEWFVTWSHGGGMLWKEPGFYAGRHDWRWSDPRPRYVYGATADDLREAIEAHPT